LKSNKCKKLVSAWLETNPSNPLLVVLGPTASGKTKLAIQLAKKFDGEIVNADSRQIYRELEIGSAPPTNDELAQIPHHLVAEFSPKETVSTAKYRKLAEKKIREISQRGKLAILSGGHTLLISAIVENFRFPGKADEKQRDKLIKIWQKDPQKLWKRLEKIDPELAEKIPAENQHHLIRAVERAENHEKPCKGRRKFNCLILGISVERAELYRRIDQRVEKMLKAGLLDEVKNLAKKYDRYSPALRGHGYRELLDFLAGEKTLEQAITEIKKDTRNYAKRQSTWWRNCGFTNEIEWF